MSVPRTMDVHESVRRADTSTDRGSFATWVCSPHDTSLPRGNVLLVPGFTGSKEDFAPLLPLLAESGWSAATYDQRGQFETKADPGDDFTLEGFSADLVAVAPALFGNAERVHLVGHSLGGLVTAVAALEHPEPWASLTLMCSGPGAIEGARAQQALEAADLIENEGLDAAWLAKVNDYEERGVETSAPDVEEFLHRRFFDNSPASLAAMSRHIATAPDRTSDLAALDLPMATLRGEDDDAWPHAAQDRLADALDTRVVVIPDAAHSPAVEQPKKTRDALVRSWLG